MTWIRVSLPFLKWRKFGLRRLIQLTCWGGVVVNSLSLGGHLVCLGLLLLLYFCPSVIVVGCVRCFRFNCFLVGCIGYLCFVSFKFFFVLFIIIIFVVYFLFFFNKKIKKYFFLFLIPCAHTPERSNSLVKVSPLNIDLLLHKVLHELIILCDLDKWCIAFHVGSFLFANHARFRVCLNNGYYGKSSWLQCLWFMGQGSVKIDQFASWT